MVCQMLEFLVFGRVLDGRQEYAMAGVMMTSMGVNVFFKVVKCESKAVTEGVR